MVMVSKSSLGKASESCSSQLSEKNIPPWCSAGRIYEKRKPLKVVPRIKSFCHVRENIWNYLNDDKAENFEISERIKKKKLKTQKHPKKRNTKLFIYFFLTLVIIITYFMRDKIFQVDLFTRILPDTKLISFCIDTTSVGEECCHRMRHLTLALKRAEQALRKTHRVRKTLLISRDLDTESQVSKTKIKRFIIKGARAFKGSNTVEWKTQVNLWGLIPLWRAAQPPDTVLSSRRPIPSDCWPLSGSQGELIIELPRTFRVDLISLEHIQPDTANSAPKQFIVYGVLTNGTRMKMADGIYQQKKAAKQYFQLHNANSLKKIIFTVLSNQGNPKYTCIYRIHLYSNV